MSTAESGENSTTPRLGLISTAPTRSSVFPAFNCEQLILIGAVSLALAYRVGYWVLARPTFEDALITFAHARNAAEGLGLTHHAGEPPVHGFTSALSVLIPLLGEVVATGFGLTLLRLVSLLATIAAIYFAYRIGLRIGLGPWPLAFALGFLALERHHIFFGVAGMETQLAVAILLGSILALLERRHWVLGLSLGLAALARPDYAIWGALALVTVAMRGAGATARTVLPATFMVAPWLIFTTLYYGSPIPNTVSAKSAAYLPPVNLDTIVPWVAHQVYDHREGIALTFAPFYSDSSIVSAVIPRAAAMVISGMIFALAIIGARFTWHLMSWRPVIIFALAFLAYRTLLLPTMYFEWYLPPFTAVVALLAAAGMQGLVTAVPVLRRSASATVLLLLLIFGAHAPLDGAFEHEIRANQPIPVRQQVGEYLRTHVRPGEAVVAEPAGFIGFYSRALLYDWPGLTSKVALNTFTSLEDRSLEAFVDALQPEWLALRGWELDALQAEYPDTASLYEIRATFGDLVDWEPGQPVPTIEGYGLEVRAFSARFYVLARASSPLAAPRY